MVDRITLVSSCCTFAAAASAAPFPFCRNRVNVLQKTLGTGFRKNTKSCHGFSYPFTVQGRGHVARVTKSWQQGDSLFTRFCVSCCSLKLHQKRNFSALVIHHNVKPGATG
jgi:hypothetical protein